MPRSYDDIRHRFNTISASAGTLQQVAILEFGMSSRDTGLALDASDPCQARALGAVRDAYDRLRAEMDALEALLEPETTEAAA